MKTAIYSFKNQRIACITNADGMTPGEVSSYTRMQRDQGRAVIGSSVGRAVCMVCQRDLGPREEIPAGQVTHGCCAGCAMREYGVEISQQKEKTS